MIAIVPVACQDPVAIPPSVLLVAGEAGSGKTTLGRALAAAYHRPLLDLDTLTNPLLDTLWPLTGSGHWNADGPRRGIIRDARYAVLRSTAADLVAVGQSPILVAPFTAELGGGPAWATFVHAIRPADVVVVWLTGDADVLRARRARRGADRDIDRPIAPTTPPAIDIIGIDASLTTAQQVFRVSRAIGVRRPLDSHAALFDATFDAVLFDLDGTLVDSTAAVHRSWSRIADEFGFDLHDTAIGHGMPAAAGLTAVLGAETGPVAARRLIELETSDTTDVVPVPGAPDLLASLNGIPWAVVTSGTQPVAGARMAAAGIASPPVVVTASDVAVGKPDPEPYLLAAQRLGVNPRRCLVVEDAPVGITAGIRAGCRVLGVAGTADLSDAGADLVVDALDQITIIDTATGFALRPR